MSKLRVLECFSGIGACSKALTNLGIEHEIVDAVEIDKYAVKSFNAIHGTDFEPQDITTWDKDVECDLIFHGSPCTDFSIAGKQLGGDKDSGTRSSLMYETIRIVAKLKPKYVIWENVKNVISKKHRHNFDNYLQEMESLGYTNYYQVLNAKDYGIPQNRERVFTVSILGNENFNFPPKQELKSRLKDMLEDEVDEKYYLSNEIITKLQSYGYEQSLRLNNVNKTCETINTMAGGHREPKVGIVVKNQGKIIKRETDISTTLMARDYKGFGNQEMTGCLNNLRIRKLTPKECFRLMGFSDDDFDKASKVNSNSQLYKQAGNSIVVNVLEAIFKELL